jgi:two-component system response regulator VicR
MLADDELSMQTLIEDVVVYNGYEFVCVSDGMELLKQLETEKPDLILLDVMMPKLDGFSVCRELRERGCTVPIIFLSAKGDIVDKSMGFKAGGDDYLVKPFNPEELALRIEALFRREKRIESKHLDYICQDDIELDVKRHKVTVRGNSVELTGKEFHILLLLIQHPGEVFTREQLIQEVWGKEYIEDSSGIAVYIRHIREKIEVDPSHPRYIQTVWRVGYRFGD